MQIPWYKYLQLQYLLHSPTVATVMSRPKTPFELLLLKKDKNNWGVLSIIYKALIDAHSTQATSYQKWWERDDMFLEAETWNLLWCAFPFHAATIAVQWQFVKLMIK